MHVSSQEKRLGETLVKGHRQGRHGSNIRNPRLGFSDALPRLLLLQVAPRPPPNMPLLGTDGSVDQRCHMAYVVMAYVVVHARTHCVTLRRVAWHCQPTVLCLATCCKSIS